MLAAPREINGFDSHLVLPAAGLSSPSTEISRQTDPTLTRASSRTEPLSPSAPAAAPERPTGRDTQLAKLIDAFQLAFRSWGHHPGVTLLAQEVDLPVVSP